MTTLGTAVPAPAALTDAMALVKVALDPRAVEANLNAMGALGEQLTAQAADLEAREQTVTDKTAENAAAAAKIETEGKQLLSDLGEFARAKLELASDREALGRDKIEHNGNVAGNIARTKELDGRAAALDAAKSDMEKRAEDIAAEQHARSLELNARAEAVAKAEAEFKANVAEWQRATRALPGVSA